MSDTLGAARPRQGPAPRVDVAQLRRELKRVDATLRLVRGVHEDGAGRRAASATMAGRRERRLARELSDVVDRR